jgi:hypothetical protein
MFVFFHLFGKTFIKIDRLFPCGKMAGPSANLFLFVDVSHRTVDTVQYVLAA